MTSTTIHTTKDHETIKQWINEQGGVPARLGYDSTSRQKDPLTVWFRDEARDVKKTFQELDWDEFFAIFDHHNFVFKYNNETGKDRYVVIAPE